jgi:hypothetical protein
MPNNMTTTIRRYFTESTVIGAGMILLFILFIRVTRGLDLTDEMQYYGEIKGLIETGRLFSNDLFIQQSVYILFYPVFYLYHLFFGFDGLVFFGRLVMSLISIAVFLYAYRKLLELKFSSLISSLTALSLTFAIPYHGIFAPSYNTISQVIWIIFMLRFFEWKRSSAISWGILPLVMAFAHPTSAVTMSLLIFVRLLANREFRRVGELLLVLLGGALAAAPVILYFAAPHEYLASLAFSSGYGVGTAFFANKSQPVTLLVIYALFGSCLFFESRCHRSVFALPALVLIAAAINMFYAGRAWGAYTLRVVYVLSFLAAFAYCWALSNISSHDIKTRMRNHWLVLGLLAYATTLGVTSGNGIGQATGAFMVGFPLLLGIAAGVGSDSEYPARGANIKTACVLLVFVLFAVHWSRYPYREDVWWRTKHPIQSVPEFKFVSTSQERTVFVQRMQRALRPVAQGRRTLIVSEYPGLYFALGTHAETCMLYMHSLTSDTSEKALLDSLSKKNPELVIDIFANNDMSPEHSRIKSVMHNYYFKRGLNCMENSIRFFPISNNNPKQLMYRVCL